MVQRLCVKHSLSLTKATDVLNLRSRIMREGIELPPTQLYLR